MAQASEFEAEHLNVRGFPARGVCFRQACQHAGENLADVLKQRVAELAATIQMSDAAFV